jgi:group I intron endonuclease
MPKDHHTRRPGIYQIRHIASGKVYIGSAVDVEQRWAMHRHKLRLDAHHSTHLQRAWLKFGEPAFAFEILEFVDNESNLPDVEFRAILVDIEQSYLDRVKPFDHGVGYNGSPTAGSNLGVKHTPEALANMSAAKRLQKPVSPETRAKLAAASRGRLHTDEAKAKMSANNPMNNPDLRAKVARAALGNTRRRDSARRKPDPDQGSLF